MSIALQELKRDVRHLVLDLRQMKSFCDAPLIIRDAKGIYLTDINGKRYIDGISGIYVVNVGHGNDFVIGAIRRQQEKVSFVAPLHAVSDATVRYASRLKEITPKDLKTFKFVSGGSEATESAIKFARQYHRQRGDTSKYKIISNYTGYHGGTLGALSATGLSGPRKGVFGPFLSGFVQIPPPNCFRPPMGIDPVLYRSLCTEFLEYTIQSEGPESVAAFIVEPISNTGGVIVPPPEYWREVRSVCTQHNVLLIFDEIITGMGRTGEWFAAQTFDVTPDILCAGKGLGGGYAPLAAMIVNDNLHFSAFWGEDDKQIQFNHGHTFGGNPISAAAGLAVIEYIEKENLLKRGRVVGEHLRGQLRQEIASLGILGEVRGAGALSAVEFVEDMKTRRPFPVERRFGKRLESRLLSAGLILRCDLHWIGFGPPLTTTIPEADEIIDIFCRCVREELNADGKTLI